MSAERDILEVLQQAVTAARTAASFAPPIKYIARTFVVPNDQKYLEIVHIPSNRTDDFWGDERNHQGAFRLVLHWPNNDAGPYEPIDKLGAVCAYFTKDRQLGGGVKITQAPDFTGALESGTEILYPATARYSAFRA